MALKVTKQIEVESSVKLPFFGVKYKQCVAVLESGKTFKLFEDCIFITKSDNDILLEIEVGYYNEISKDEFIQIFEDTMNTIHIEMLNIKGQTENEFIKNVTIQSDNYDIRQ